MLTNEDILDYIISEDLSKDVPVYVQDNDEYRSFKKVWDLCDLLNESEDQPDVETAWAKVAHEIDQRVATPQKKTSTEARIVQISQQRWAAAASFLVLLGVSIYLLRPQDPYTTDLAVALPETTLPDDTHVELKEGASIRYLSGETFNAGEERIVYLEGEAIFHVKSDPNRPFKVITQETNVDVLGTVFRYKAEGEYSESENIEGKVRFSVTDTPDQSRILNPGDKISYDGEKLEFTPATLPPPPIPRNNIGVYDLVDILGDRFPIRLELAPYFDMNNNVVAVDLRGDLQDIIADMRNNINISLGADQKDRAGFFKMYRLRGDDIGLKVDYTFEDHYLGRALNQGE